MADEITPAVRRYRDYLANEYMPAARENVSITANPNGAACNAASIRRYTTVQLSPEQIFDLGNQLVSKAESTMRRSPSRATALTTSAPPCVAPAPTFGELSLA